MPDAQEKSPQRRTGSAIELAVTFYVILNVAFWYIALWCDAWQHILIHCFAFLFAVSVFVLQSIVSWFKSGGVSKAFNDLREADIATELLRCVTVLPLCFSIVRSFYRLLDRMRLERPRLFALATLPCVSLTLLALDEDHLACGFSYVGTLFVASIPIVQHFELDLVAKRVQHSLGNTAVACRNTVYNGASHSVSLAGRRMVAIGNSVKSTLDAVVDFNVSCVKAVGMFFYTGYSSVCSGIFFIGSSIRAFFVSCINSVLSVIYSAYSSLKSGVFAIRDVFCNFLDATRRRIISVKNAIASFFLAIWDFFMNIPQRTLQGLIYVKNGIISVARGTAAACQRCLHSLISSIQSALSCARSFIYACLLRTKDGARNSVVYLYQCAKKGAYYLKGRVVAGFLAFDRAISYVIRSIASGARGAARSVRSYIAHCYHRTLDGIRATCLYIKRRTLEAAHAFKVWTIRQLIALRDWIAASLKALQIRIRDYIKDTWIEPIVNYMVQSKHALEAYIQKQVDRFKRYVYNSYIFPVVNTCICSYLRTKLFILNGIIGTCCFVDDNFIMPLRNFIVDIVGHKAPYLDEDSDDEYRDYLPKESLVQNSSAATELMRWLSHPVDSLDSDSELEDFLPEEPKPSNIPKSRSTLDPPLGASDFSRSYDDLDTSSSLLMPDLSTVIEPSDDEDLSKFLPSSKATPNTRRRTAAQEQLLERTLARKRQAEEIPVDPQHPDQPGILTTAFSFVGRQAMSALASGAGVLADYIKPVGEQTANGPKRQRVDDDWGIRDEDLPRAMMPEITDDLDL